MNAWGMKMCLEDPISAILSNDHLRKDEKLNDYSTFDIECIY